MTRVLEDRTPLLDTDPNAERKTGRCAADNDQFSGASKFGCGCGEYIDTATPWSTSARRFRCVCLCPGARHRFYTNGATGAHCRSTTPGRHTDECHRQCPACAAVAAVATVFMVIRSGRLAAELQTAVAELLTQLEADGAQIYVPRSDRAYTIRVGCAWYAAPPGTRERRHVPCCRQEFAGTALLRPLDRASVVSG